MTSAPKLLNEPHHRQRARFCLCDWIVIRPTPTPFLALSRWDRACKEKVEAHAELR